MTYVCAATSTGDMLGNVESAEAWCRVDRRDVDVEWVYCGHSKIERTALRLIKELYKKPSI